MIGDSSSMRKTRSPLQKESLAFFQENPLLLERYYKLRDRCFMMLRSYQQFFSLKNQLDHVTFPLGRKDKANISSPLCHQTGIRWRDSHAQYQETSAHKDNQTTLLLHTDADCRNIFKSILFKNKFSLDVKTWSWF